MDDNRNTGPASGNASQKACFGAMRVDDIVVTFLNEVFDLKQGLDVAQRPKRPLERRKGEENVTAILSTLFPFDLILTGR
jgi:hypothetical protein